MVIFGKRSDSTFSHKSDRKKEKRVVSFTHKQNIICSQTQLNDIAHEQTNIYRQLFVGHVVRSRPMKRTKNLHRMISNPWWCWNARTFFDLCILKMPCLFLLTQNIVFQARTNMESKSQLQYEVDVKRWNPYHRISLVILWFWYDMTLRCDTRYTNFLKNIFGIL